MNMRYILLTCLVFLYVFLIITIFSSCKNFNGNFHYSPHVVSFHLNELIIAQRDIPIFIVRFFLNKVSITFIDGFYRYIQYFDILYFANTIGIVGIFGLFYFYFQCFIKKNINKYNKILAVILFLLPFIEIFQFYKQPFLLKIINIIIPYQIASYIGIFFYLKQRSVFGYSILLLLFIVSIGWIIVFHGELTSFCTASY